MIIYPTLLILIFGNRHIKPKELENDALIIILSSQFTNVNMAFNSDSLLLK